MHATTHPDDYAPAYIEQENATQFLKTLVERLAKVSDVNDKTLDKLFDNDVLKALAELRISNTIEYQRIKLSLKKVKGFSVTDWDNTVKAVPKLDIPANEPTNEPDYSALIEAGVQQLNKIYANVLFGCNQRIMKKVPAYCSESGQDEYIFIPKDDFLNLHANDLIQVGINKEGVRQYSNKARLWLKHPKCRVYRDGIVFRPLPLGAPPLKENVFNLWEGFEVEPNKGNWSAIDRHIREVICNNYEPLISYFYDWIAYKLQNPHMQAGSVFVVRGNKGTGKGIIGRFLASLWGSHSLQISDSAHLTGKFNGHLARVCFLFSDEAFFAGDKAAESVLKRITTEPTLTIESKGIDARQSPNYLQIFMAANDDWVVPVSADDRRYCVTEASDKYKGNHAYFDALVASCDNSATKSAFLYDMLKRDVSNWRSGAIPETDALKEQRFQSLHSDSVKSWLVDYLGECWKPIERIVDVNGCTSIDSVIINHSKTFYYFDNCPTTKNLYDNYLEWCQARRKSEFKIESSVRNFGKKLADVFPTKRTNQQRGFYLGDSINEARFTIMRAYKIEMEVLEPDVFNCNQAIFDAVKWLKENA